MKNPFQLIFLALILAGCERDLSLQADADQALETVRDCERSGGNLTDSGPLAPAMDYYARKEGCAAYAELWYYQGRIQLNRGELSSAIVSLDKAARCSEALGNRHLAGLAYRSMADAYNWSLNVREDTLYLFRALDAFQAGGDSLYAQEVCLRLAGAFCNDFQWDKACRYYGMAAPVSGNNASYGKQYAASYGAFLLDAPSGDPREALRLLEEARLPESPLSGWMDSNRGYAYFLNGEPERGKALWDSLETAMGGLLPSLDYRRYLLARKEGNTGRALALLERNAAFQDSLLRRQTSELLSRAQRDYMAVVAEEERLEKDREREHRRLAIAVGALVAVLLVLLGWALYQHGKARLSTLRQALSDARRLVSRLEEAQQKYQNRIHTLNRDVRNARSALEDARAEYLYMFRNAYSRLGSLFEARHYAKSEAALCEKVCEILKEIDGDRTGSRELKRFIERRLDRPIGHLKADIPDLGEADIRLFCYLVIGYDASLISLLMGIDSLGTVYSRKKRLLDRIRKLPASKARRYLDLVA